MGVAEKEFAPMVARNPPSLAGFEGMVKVYGDFVRWLDEGYF